MFFQMRGRFKKNIIFHFNMVGNLFKAFTSFQKMKELLYIIPATQNIITNKLEKI